MPEQQPIRKGVAGLNCFDTLCCNMIDIIKVVHIALFTGKRVNHSKGELTMDAKELKKILAGIGVVGLLAGGGVAIPGSAGASG